MTMNKKQSPSEKLRSKLEKITNVEPVEGNDMFPMNKKQNKELEEKIKVILYDYGYSVDSDYGDMTHEEADEVYVPKLLALFASETNSILEKVINLFASDTKREKLELIERIKMEVIGEDEDLGSIWTEGKGWEVLTDSNLDGRNSLKKEQNQNLDHLKKEMEGIK